MVTQTGTENFSPIIEAGPSVEPSHRAPSTPRNRRPSWSSTRERPHTVPKRPWQSKHVLGGAGGASESLGRLSHEAQIHGSRPATRPIKKGKWWHVRLFRGMVNDVRRRAPFYLSDWTDAWTYRVVPSTGVFAPCIQGVALIMTDNSGF
jgi:HCO3- transporter family